MKKRVLLYSKTRSRRDSPNDSEVLTGEDIDELIKEIQEDFAKGGHS